MNKPTLGLHVFKRYFKPRTAKQGRRAFIFSVDKRQKFVIAVIVLSLGLFFTEFQFNQSAMFISLVLAVVSDLFLLWAIYSDVKENKTYEPFILPFFYSLAFGLFYFLTPPIFLSRIILSVVYAFGLYSLFLSQNILVVSSIRTIALLSGARIVSFVVTLVSFFFLTNIIYSLHVTIFPVILSMLIYTSLLMYHSLWTYTLQKVSQPLALWIFALTICLIEAGTLLWFWPTNPTVIALFLTGFFYTIVGLSHIWFEKRLFKGILWEYVWVGCVVFLVLVFFTPWGK